MERSFRARLVEKSLRELERVLDESESDALRLQAAQTALKFFSEEARGESGVDGLAALRALFLESADESVGGSGG